VLSTPPAFVLSQDQTLQQNLENKTRQRIAKKKQTKTTGYNKHPVEFSNNTRTPHPPPFPVASVVTFPI